MKSKVAKGLIGVAGLGFVGFSALQYQKCQRINVPASLYQLYVNPIVTSLSAEEAHEVAVKGLRTPKALRRVLGLVEDPEKYQVLRTDFCGLDVANCIGLAAGFDKDADAIAGIEDLGFGLVEIGSVTPLPQKGNPKPRVWRFRDLDAVVNCYGFNSKGHEHAQQRLEAYRETRKVGGRVAIGVNLGKNKLSRDHISDYVKGVERLGKYADYLVVNVSSPNTPGLRNLQHKDQLKALLSSVKEARNSVSETNKRSIPLLVKIAPDVTDEDCADIAEVVRSVGIEGIIVSNTTIEFPDSIKSLSGRPVFAKSTSLLRKIYRLTGGNVPLVGVGGIFTGEDAYRKIRSGASVVQLYSSMALEGPHVVERVRKELAQLLERDGFSSVKEAVGVDAQ